MRFFKHKITTVILLVSITTIIFSGACMSNVSAAEPVVVVIDPGHGGSNLGTDYLPIPEKNYTMAVALYMKEQLEKYQNVQVYLTHSEDIDMSLEKELNLQTRFMQICFSLHLYVYLTYSLWK